MNRYEIILEKINFNVYYIILKTEFFNSVLVLEHIETEESNRNLNPFRKATRTLCSMCRQSFIESRERHTGSFPR